MHELISETVAVSHPDVSAHSCSPKHQDPLFVSIRQPRGGAHRYSGVLFFCRVSARGTGFEPIYGTGVVFYKQMRSLLNFNYQNIYKA